jgi:hypothetical protein
VEALPNECNVVKVPPGVTLKTLPRRLIAPDGFVPIFPMIRIEPESRIGRVAVAFKAAPVNSPPFTAHAFMARRRSPAGDL